MAAAIEVFFFSFLLGTGCIFFFQSISSYLGNTGSVTHTYLNDLDVLTVRNLAEIGEVGDKLVS